MTVHDKGSQVALNEDGTVTYTFTGQAVGLTLEVVADAYVPDVDALTADYFAVWRVQHERNEHDFGCTCGRVPEARHTETCLVTPVFAEMCRTLGTVRDIGKPILDEMLKVIHRPGWPRYLTEDQCAMCDGDMCDPELGGGICPVDAEDG